MFTKQNVKLMNKQTRKDVIGSKQCFKLKFPWEKIYNENKIYNKIKSKSKLVVKQWSFEALGVFDKTNSMRKYFLVNRVSILVRTI